MPVLVWLTGASGAGKSTLAHALQVPGIAVEHFDSVGVPPPELMPSDWQEQTTHHWVRRAATDYAERRAVVIDGQASLVFVLAAAKEHGVEVLPVLVHCDDRERHRRLHHRNQPELVNARMDDWARYLREQARELHAHIVDTTWLDPEQAAQAVLALLP